MSDDTDTNLDRRSVLKKSAAGAFGLGGLAVGTGAGKQDEPERARYSRRMAFNYPERLGQDLTRKIVLMTDRTNDNPDVSEVAACEFANWPTDDINIWEGILVELEGVVGRYFGAGTDVTAEQLVERKRIFVDDQRSPIELGTPYIINRVESCPNDYVGVTATKLPGIDIQTPPDVGTDGN